MSNLVKQGATGVSRTDGQTGQLERFVQPRVSVYERADDVLLELEMPGVERDKIEVSVERDELTITGWRQTVDKDQYEVLHQERLPVSFRRSFVLGEQLDGTRISAAFKDGVLSLMLPKAEQAKPRKIAVQ
jgi:HSP20 family protein